MPEIDNHFAAHIVRRLSAEELWDAISQASGVFDEYKSIYSLRTHKRVTQASFHHDYEGKYKSTFNLLQCFGQTDRDLRTAQVSFRLRACSIAIPCSSESKCGRAAGWKRC